MIAKKGGGSHYTAEELELASQAKTGPPHSNPRPHPNPSPNPS